jgi:hypothetical protein
LWQERSAESASPPSEADSAAVGAEHGVSAHGCLTVVLVIALQSIGYCHQKQACISQGPALGDVPAVTV